MTSQSIDTLIIVCCHAIYLDGNVEDEKNWLIEPFQIGETPTFTTHIQKGIDLLKQNENAILTFSGGATKQGRIRELKSEGSIASHIRKTRTEAESYHDVAKVKGFFEAQDTGVESSLMARTFNEDYATDSYQNVLLALLQYPVWRRMQKTDATNYRPGTDRKVDFVLPENLIIVSHEFKRARFLDLHVPAIMRLLGPLAGDEHMNVDYVGINPPFDEEKMKQIEEGDRKRGHGVWQGDLYGTGELLAGKRLARGWDSRGFLDKWLPWYETSIAQQLIRIVTGVE